MKRRHLAEERRRLRFVQGIRPVNHMDTHELVTPTTKTDWDNYHQIRREVLFEARGRFGVYNPDHPDDRAPGNHPKLLIYRGEPVGVVRIDIDGRVAALRRVAIRSGLRRRGHGRVLLTLAERFAVSAGCTRLVSSVASDAIPFYQGFGFVIDAERAVASSANNSVFMTKDLGLSSGLTCPRPV
jgi:GNAT superfamily N-acetyltransferase